MSRPLKDHVVLITGSSRGLGLALAKAFRRSGSKVIINYRNPASQPIAEAAADEVDGVAIRADVTDPDAVKELFAQAEHVYRQPVSVVVNNALADFKFNGEKRTKLGAFEWEDFDRQLRGTLRGAVNTTQAALPGFEKLGYGRIINIGTNLVNFPWIPYHDYVAAKGALVGFTRTSAVELGPKNITVNMVSGGLLSVTDASKETEQETFDQIKALTPLRRITSPEDVTGAVLFFASPWADAVSGQTIVVDGGLTMN